MQDQHAPRIGVLESNGEVDLGQPRADVLGPLDHADRVRAEVLGEACVSPFVRIAEAIEIKVIEV
jgi:hypothetical protein